MDTSKSGEKLLFDHNALRLIVGGIAIFFPCVVVWRAQKITLSISSSYHTNAHDIFVGFLFIIGTLLVSYKGHEHTSHQSEGSTIWNCIIKHQEDIVSTIGGLAAIVTALFPTNCDGCDPDINSCIHMIGAFILFSTVVYFCRYAFTSRVKDKIKEEGVEIQKLYDMGREGSILASIQKLEAMQVIQRRRIKFYSSYGWAIAFILLSSIILSLLLPDNIKNNFPVLFIAETISLELFGVAWLTASHVLPFLFHNEERYCPFSKRMCQEALPENFNNV